MVDVHPDHGGPRVSFMPRRHTAERAAGSG
jgi:hypothetical protein